MLYEIYASGGHTIHSGGGCEVHPPCVLRLLRQTQEYLHHAPRAGTRLQIRHCHRRFRHRGLRRRGEFRPVSPSRRFHHCPAAMAAGARERGADVLLHHPSGRHALCPRYPGHSQAGRCRRREGGLRLLLRLRAGILPVPAGRKRRGHGRSLRSGHLYGCRAGGQM